MEWKNLLHLLSQGYAYIFGLLFCQANVNSHHPIEGELPTARIFVWGGYVESENCLKKHKRITIEWKPYKVIFFVFHI